MTRKKTARGAHLQKLNAVHPRRRDHGDSCGSSGDECCPDAASSSSSDDGDGGGAEQVRKRAREKKQRQRQRTADAKELGPAAPAPIRPPTSLRSFFSRPPSAPPPASGAPQPPSPAPAVTTADRIADPPDPPAYPATTPPNLLPADLPDDVVAASAATSPSAVAAATSPEPGESCSICLELIHASAACNRARLTHPAVYVALGREYWREYWRWGELAGRVPGRGSYTYYTHYTYYVEASPRARELSRRLSPPRSAAEYFRPS